MSREVRLDARLEAALTPAEREHVGRLRAAVAVFRELGWEGATPQDAPGLALGTKEQQKIAKDGLRAGAWRLSVQANRNHWVNVDVAEVDPLMLALFALRLGIGAQRFAAILPAAVWAARTEEGEAAVAGLVRERGEAFALSLARAVSRPTQRGWAGTPFSLASVSVPNLLSQGLDAHDLETGKSGARDAQGFLTDWAALTNAARRAHEGQSPSRGERPPAWAWESDANMERWEDVLRQQGRHDLGNARLLPVLSEGLEARLRAALAAGVTASSGLSELVGWGARAGLLQRAAAVDLAVQGLDAAGSPGDRLEWAQLLAEGLGASDEELAAEALRLAGPLSTGDGAVIEALAPRLIAAAAEAELPDVVLPALAARTKKARRAVIDALAARPRPEAGVAQELGAAVGPLLAETGPLARAAERLLASWGVEAVPDEAEADVPAGARWEPTPAVWTPGPLLAGPATPERLSGWIAAVVARRTFGTDALAERLLADAVDLASRDLDAALACFESFIESGMWQLAIPASRALRRSPKERPYRERPGALFDRAEAALRALGEAPLLLSTPSDESLRITGADLVARLGVLAQRGLGAEEYDALVAAYRLDPATVDRSVREALAASRVRLGTGWRTGRHVGEFVLSYLADPVREPALATNPRTGRLYPEKIVAPASVRDVAHAVPGRGYGEEVATASLFPHWSDAVAALPAFDAVWFMEVLWDQQARRAEPFTPLAATALLGTARGQDGERGAALAESIAGAWKRGLLRPGSFDPELLDLKAGPPERLAALSGVLSELAGEGGGAFAWDAADRVLAASAAASRLLSGSAELATLMRSLAPEAVAAVASGVAPASVLESPGLRAVAARGGASAAVAAAKAAVALLPEVTSGQGTTAPSRPGEPVPAGERAASGEKNPTPKAAGHPAPHTLVFLPVPAHPAVDIDDGGVVRVQTGADGVHHAGIALPALGREFFDAPTSRPRELAETGGVWLAGYTGEVAPTGARREELYRLRWDALAGRMEILGREEWHAALLRPAHREGFLQRLKGAFAKPAAPAPVVLSRSLVSSALAGMASSGAPGTWGRKLAGELARAGALSAANVRAAAVGVAPQLGEALGTWVSVLEKDREAIVVFWPLLEQALEVAAGQDGIPRWLNRALDIGLAVAPELAELRRRGLIPARWEALETLAARPGTTAALKKARELKEALA